MLFLLGRVYPTTVDDCWSEIASGQTYLAGKWLPKGKGSRNGGFSSRAIRFLEETGNGWKWNYSNLDSFGWSFQVFLSLPNHTWGWLFNSLSNLDDLKKNKKQNTNQSSTKLLLVSRLIAVFCANHCDPSAAGDFAPAIRAHVWSTVHDDPSDPTARVPKAPTSDISSHVDRAGAYS